MKIKNNTLKFTQLSRNVFAVLAVKRDVSEYFKVHRFYLNFSLDNDSHFSCNLSMKINN